MKIDLHVHTSEVSRCGKMPAEETVHRYKEAGYDAIVITNHFDEGTAQYYAENGKPDFFAVHADGLRLAQQAGEREGLLVLGGYELSLKENGNDYLIYGMPDSVARGYQNLFDMSLRSVAAMAQEYHFLIYQAHPFRNGMTVCDPQYLFGVESLNAAATCDNRNDIAEQWAIKYHLHRIGGSDCHRAFMVGRGGIETDRPVRTINDLLDVLRNDDYRILIPSD